MQDIEGTIIDQVHHIMSFIRKHLNIAASIKGKPEREDIWEIPREALREAVINAVCHRDYESPANVQIRIFDNRLEIWNPGLLPADIAIDDLKKEHSSIPRNQLIAGCFYKIKYIEQWGTGTNRIVRLCKEAGITEPDFKEASGSFVISFPRVFKPKLITEIKLSSVQKNIVKYLSKVSEASGADIADAIGVNASTIYRNINKLKEIVRWTGKSPNDPQGKFTLVKHIDLKGLDLK